MQSLWKTIWRFFKNITSIWSSNTTSELYPKQIKSVFWRDICTAIFIAVLFTIAKIWKQLYGVTQSRTRLKRLSSSIKCVISCKNQVVISEIEKSKYGKTAERNKKDNSNIAKRELDSLGIVIVLRLWDLHLLNLNFMLICLLH